MLEIERPWLTKSQFRSILRNHSLHTDMLVAKALYMASRSHEGQTRESDNRSYLEGHVLPIAAHVLKVVSIKPRLLGESGYTRRDVLLMALLHDVVEGHDTPEGRARASAEIGKKFGEKIAGGVAWLTKEIREKHPDPATDLQPRTIHDFKYKETVFDAPPAVQLVKLSDNLMNALDPVHGNDAKLADLLEGIEHWKMLVEILEPHGKTSIYMRQLEQARTNIDRIRKGEPVEFKRGMPEFEPDKERKKPRA